MSGKIAIIAGIGAAALLLTKKKKKPSKSTEKSLESDVVLSGTESGWGWRVRKIKSEPVGFADRYIGEIQSPGSSSWDPAHEKTRAKPEEAKYLALEFIATRIAMEGQIVFDWEPARAHSEEKLREEFPNTSLSIMEAGSMTKNDVKCHWSIMSVLPPIPQGAYAGFVICPSTNEQISGFSDSILSIKKSLGIS